MEGSHRGRVRSLGKRVYRKVSRVRIPPLPHRIGKGVGKTGVFPRRKN